MLGATVLSFCVLLGRSYVLCEVLTLHVAVMYWNQTGEPSSTNHSLGCATLAEKDLRTAGLLPAELEFVYHTFNSKWPGVCLLDKRGGIVATVDFYYNHNVSAFIGPFCSSEQTTAAQLAKVWNLPIVRFQATSPVLKDKAVFSTLAGMNPADSAEFAAAHTVLLHKWGYTRVAMFYTDYIAVQIRMQGMREELTAGGFNVTVDAEVKEDSTYEEILQSDHLKTIRENSRVLLISMGKPVGMNIRLLKALDTLNMTYKNGYLILMNQVTPGWHLDPWNDPIMLEYGDVTKEECRRLFSYTITFELKDLTVASMQAFFDRVREHAGSSPESSHEEELVNDFWPYPNSKPPKDPPLCGYINEHCPYEDPNRPFYIVIGILLVIIVIILLYFGRRNKMKRDLYRMPWHIVRDNVHVRNSNAVATWRFNQDNLNRFLGLCFNEQSEFLIIWRLPPRGYLQDILFNDDIELDKNFRSSFIRDIAKGLNYLHQSTIGVHGCLSTQTCVVESHWVVKLSEFALNNLLFNMHERGQLSTPPSKTTQELYHLAPELLEDAMGTGCYIATQESDIYSLGIVLYQILYRLELYVDLFISSKDVLEQLTMTKDVVIRPIIPQEPSYSTELVNIIKKCWSQETTDRPTIKEIKNLLETAFSNTPGTVVEHLMTMMESYATNLEKLVKDRTMQLVEAQQRADGLLAQLLPKSVVDDLKAGKRITPLMYPEATILFSDLVSFTSLCSRSSPLEIVTFLNDLYSSFDAVIEKLQVYKVETVGDAYMVVSGLPEQIGDKHVTEIAELAIAMREIMRSFKVAHMPGHQLDIRIGFHSGPVAAGVVGIAMPRYCLFGDTVNFAARMESTSEAMKIQLTEASYELLKDRPQYQLQERGKIFVKGKGECLTYWLVDKMWN